MGKLYIVPTPIGNLGDMTYRGVEVLKSVDFILAEDTRVSKRLLDRYEINQKLIAYHDRNEHRVTDKYVSRLQTEDVNIALISDAGMPGISDPGYLLIRKCVERGIELECLPGAASILPALIKSGLPTDRFCYEGFLPHKKGRQKRIKALADEERTMIFFESPYRIVRLLGELSEAFGKDRKASFSRELTKIHEESRTDSLENLISWLSNPSKKIKGEFILVVAGKAK